MEARKLFVVGQLLCQVALDTKGWWLTDKKGCKHFQLLDVSIVTDADNIKALQVTLGWFWCLFGWVTVTE